jgi:hypothetical protein
MDPMQRLINMTKEAYVDPKKRAFLPRMQQQLWDMTRAQLPGTYQTNTPMSDPIISESQARMFTTARDDARFQPEPNAVQSSMERSFGERNHVHGPRPGPIAGAPIYQQPTPEPRDAPDTQLFLADVVNRQQDDVFREVAYKIIDGMGLRIGVPSDEAQLTLENPETNERVTFNGEEFIQAVSFIADGNQTTVTVINPESKTAELLHLFSRPDNRWRLHRWVSGELPADIRHRDVTSVRDKVRAWTALQDRLNWVRERIQPVTSAPPVRSWLQTLTMGMAGSDNNEVTAERLAAGVPLAQRSSVIDLLNGMRAENLISWNDTGQLIDGENDHTIINSNLYNIISNLFNPANSGVSAGHSFHYVPTGADEFVEKMMEYRRRNGQIAAEIVQAVQQQSGEGRMRWTARRLRNGTWTSLIRMWNLYRQWMPLASLGLGTLSSFIAVMQRLGQVDFEWHSWYTGIQYVTGTGNHNAVTVASESMFAPILNWLDRNLGYRLRAPLQTLIENNSQYIGGAIVATAVGTMAKIAGVIGAWALSRFMN